MKKRDVKVILFYVFLIVITIVVLSQLFQRNNNAKPLTYDNVVQLFKNEEVAEFTLSQNNLLTMKLTNGTQVSYKLASLSIFHADLGEEITAQMAAGTLKGEYEPATAVPW